MGKILERLLAEKTRLDPSKPKKATSKMKSRAKKEEDDDSTSPDDIITMIADESLDTETVRELFRSMAEALVATMDDE